MITLDHVSKIYPMDQAQDVQAVHGVSLTVNRGEFIVITGRSGSGKTTLLNLIAGLARPTAGKVTIQDQEIWNLTEKELAHLRNRTMGFVFQFPSLMPSLTVLDNVLLPVLFDPAQNTRDVKQRAIDLLEEVGLADKLRAFPRQLSAGQQQRVVIARALINQPEILLADEPTSDLDEQTEQEIMQLFKRFHTELGVTVLMVTHTNELIAFGTRALRMASGVFVN